MNSPIRLAIAGIFLLAFLVTSTNSQAQQSEIAKWESNLAQASNDSLRFAALIKLFSLNARIKIDLANEYLVKAEEIAKGNQSVYFKGVVLNQRAVYFNFKAITIPHLLMQPKHAKYWKGVHLGFHTPRHLEL
jgi:hypothetical protein